MVPVIARLARAAEVETASDTAARLTLTAADAVALEAAQAADCACISTATAADAAARAAELASLLVIAPACDFEEADTSAVTEASALLIASSTLAKPPPLPPVPASSLRATTRASSVSARCSAAASDLSSRPWTLLSAFESAMMSGLVVG